MAIMENSNLVPLVSVISAIVSVIGMIIVILKSRHETRVMDADAAEKITNSAVKQLEAGQQIWDKRVEDLDMAVKELKAENLILAQAKERLESELKTAYERITELESIVGELRDRIRELTNPKRKRT